MVNFEICAKTRTVPIPSIVMSSIVTLMALWIKLIRSPTSVLPSSSIKVAFLTSPCDIENWIKSYHDYVCQRVINLEALLSLLHSPICHATCLTDAHLKRFKRGVSLIECKICVPVEILLHIRSIPNCFSGRTF